MMIKLCLVYLFSVIIVVSSNPLGQLVQSCNACPPTSYSSPISVPVVIQQPSSSSSYSQASTAQVPTTYPGPLGESLNQIVLNRILSNPSLQKIIDPNTKLYNQNGNEVQRQVPNTGTPNVINNYFIVPPEFFSLNETTTKNQEGLVEIDKTAKTPRHKKLKRRLKKLKKGSAEDDKVVTKQNRKRRKHNQPKNTAKRKRIDDDYDEIESVELVDDHDKSKETTVRDQERKVKQKNRSQKKKKKEVASTPDETIEDESNELEDHSSVVTTKNKKIKNVEIIKPNPNRKHVGQESYEIGLEEPEAENSKEKSLLRDKVKDLEDFVEIPKKGKKERKEHSTTSAEDKTLKNIELPTDVSNRAKPENRPTRDSKKVPEPKSTTIPKREPLPKMTPFPDDVLKNFFPYMPMGNFNNPYANYPTNFDHYYRYLDPVRNSNANRNKNKRKNQNTKTKEAKSNTHTIEIKLKPKNKLNATETPVTTEQPNNVHEVTLSIDVEQSTESIEEVTVIPLEMPHKVSPIINDDQESASRESYETFSKLESLHDFIIPELGKEDEVLPMSNNGIINDYYPVFDDDVYYNPVVEKVNNFIKNDRYFYKTGDEDKLDKEIKKLDRYEDSKNFKRDNHDKKIEMPESKTKKLDQDIEKFNHKDNLDHISTFSDTDSSEHDIVKSSDEIRRVKIPSKNIRVKAESVETVFAGSKVAKYGVPPDTKVEEYSSIHSADESSSNERHTSYVVAKSIGHPDDYW